MKKRIGMPFCTNVLRIALNMKENFLASILVSDYKISVDEQMIIRAIRTK